MPSGSANLVPNTAGSVGPALRHGAYSVLRLRGRAEEIRAELEEIVPMLSPADGPMLDTLAMLLSQVERASIILGALQVEETEAIREGKPVPKGTAATLQRLSQDARGWANSAARLADRMGLTAASRAQLSRDVATTHNALQALDDHLRRKRAEDG